MSMSKSALGDSDSVDSEERLLHKMMMNARAKGLIYDVRTFRESGMGRCGEGLVVQFNRGGRRVVLTITHP